MRPEAKKYLYDIAKAAQLIANFTNEKSFQTYQRDAMILIHGYAEIDDRIVWDIVESKLPALRQELASLLEEQ